MGFFCFKGENIMGKSDDIIKVLSFYMRVNTLKDKIVDEKNSYSIADHLFGSMILGTAIDSEFKEAKELSKIYRMIFLNDFNEQYSDYDYETLKLGRQYKKEIFEIENTNSNEGKLVSKYKILDLLLTKLIREKDGKIDNYQLIKEGSSTISSLCNKEATKCEEIFKFYYFNFRLKNKVRSAWDNNHWNVKSNRIEKISEHVIGTFGLALVMSSEFNYNIDIDKVLEMLVIHEIGETIIGDITPFDGITPEEKKEIEHKAMIDVLGNLIDKDSLLSLLYEFDEQKTPEAKFAHYCDKIEADLQAKVYQDKGLQRSLDDQENNCVFKSPKVQKMLGDGASTAFDIWYEWDKSIYEGDKDFPEFSSMLKIVKMCNLMNLLIDKNKEIEEVEETTSKKRFMQLIRRKK